MILLSKKQIAEFGIPKGCKIIRWLDNSAHAWVGAKRNITTNDLIRLNSWGMLKGIVPDDIS